MTSITWAGPRCVQEAAAISGPQNCIQGRCAPFSDEDILVITEAEVQTVLENLKLNKSERKNDIPAKVFKRFAKKLCIPITKLVNSAIRQGVWPNFMKLEVITPVPKVAQPKTVDSI